MNTDPHTKANLFYTVSFILTADPYQWTGKRAGVNEKIPEHNGDEVKSKVVQYQQAEKRNRQDWKRPGNFKRIKWIQ